MKTIDLDSTDNNYRFTIDYWECPCEKIAAIMKYV